MASDELLDRMDAVWKQMPAAARDAMNEYAADLARESLAATSEIARLRAALETAMVTLANVTRHFDHGWDMNGVVNVARALLKDRKGADDGE